MRKIDESRAANYIRKHSNYKKWLAFVLCLSLLTGTVTLYILNKPATAMTEEGAESLGVVLETASNADEEELIQQTLENKVESDEGGDDDDLFSEFNEDGDDESDDELEESGDDEEKQDDLVEEEVKEGELTEGEEQKEETEEEEDELTQDVVLTVSYVDEDGEAIADEKEIDIYDSIDLTSEAPSIEGYTFKEATFKGDVITKVTVKKNADDIRYYEVTFDDDETKEIKKDAAVVLTYIKDEEEIEVDASVNLTAKYVDKDGEDIQDSEEISFAKETSINKDNAPEIDGYFFMKAVYDGQEIVKITPVEAEAEVEAEDSDNEEETTEETEKVKSVSVEGYEFTTADGDTVEITEDAEIEYTYLKASEETEFTYADGKVTVTATINGKNVFPEGIELKAAEVTKDSSSYNYDAYMDALNENAEAIAEDAGQEQANEFTEDNTLLYDIAFVYEGKEVQPKEGTVSISINFKKKQLSEELSAASKDDVTVVHLPIKEDVKEENEIINTEDAAGITASDIEVITLTDATAAVEGNEKVEFETEGFSIFAVLAYQHHDYGTDTYETVLGDAVNFALVADEITTKESETNFAANKIVSSEAQSGNDLTNYVEQTFLVAEPLVDFYIKGYPAYFIVPDEYKDRIHAKGDTLISLDTSYTKKQLNTIVNDMLKYTRAASADLATRDSNLSLEKRDGKWVIDTTTLTGNKTYYVNISAEDFKNISGADNLQIYKQDDQTIVFNVEATGDLTFYKFSVNGTPTDSIAGQKNNKDSVTSEYAKYARTLIWNFINADSVTTQTPVVGVMISGKTNAKWENNGTSAGWVAFPRIKIGSGEWHNTYDKVKKLSGTTQLQAYKTIDGEPSNVSGFKFGVYKQKSNGSFEENPFQTVENNGHDIVFETIEYGEDATKKDQPNYELVSLDNDGKQVFIYQIKETATKNNLIMDKTVYYAKVIVEKVFLMKNANGDLTGNSYIRVSNPEYFTDEECVNSIGTIPTFNNITDGNISFHLFKYVNGQAANQTFRFKVQVLDAENSGGKKGRLVTIPGKEIIENTAADLSFSVLKSELKDISHFIIKTNNVFFVVSECSKEDQNESVQNYGFDTRPIVVKITLNNDSSLSYQYYRVPSLDLDTNDLESYIRNTVCKDSNLIQGVPAFENTLDAEAQVKVKKNFTGGTWTSDMEFEFNIAAISGVKRTTVNDVTQEIQITDISTIPIPESTVMKVQGDGTNSQDVDFGNIRYSNAGEYKYVISEKKGGNDEVQYDSKKIYVKVTVSPNMEALVQYFSDDAFTSRDDAISFTNSLKSSLIIKKKWTKNGVVEPNPGFNQPVYVKVYRSVSEDADQAQVMMWDRVSVKEGEYKEGEYKASDSGTVEMLPIYENHDWQIKLLIDKAHPDNPDQDYYYFVQEFVVKDALTDEKVEKTDLVFYSSSYKNKTSENWKEVYAIGNADKDPTFTLTITNELGDNVLPSTGGVGDIPYLATGLGTAVAGIFGAGVYSRKKKKDDEE